MANAIRKALMPRVGDISPASVAAAGTATSGWIKADTSPEFCTQVNLGALGGGTVTLTFEQANTSGGGGAKALSAWTGGSSAVNDANFEVDNDADKLDHANGFLWFRAVLTNVGGTGALCSAIINSGTPRAAA